MPRVAPEYSLEYREEARRKIMDAALHVAAAKGYHDATMDDVADSIGVSKGTLYLYFKSKEELFKAINERFQDRLKESLNRMFTQGKFPDFNNMFGDEPFPREDFTSLWLELASESTRDETLRKMIAAAVEKRIELIQTWLEEQKKKGDVNAKADSRYTSIAVFTCLVGISFLSALRLDKSELRRAFTKSLNAIIEAA
jgi:AcrR family transcriptional regulator